MPNSTSEQEVAIGQHERAYDLQKQICIEITRGLSHLNRQLQLADPSQRFKIDQQISAAEIRLSDARERFENAAAELREAYSWRGGAVPSVDTQIDIESKAPVFEEESEVVRQLGLETALRKVQEDAIPYSTKLAVTTALAVTRVFRKQSEPIIAEPVTLPEKIAACERNINRTRSEIDFFVERLRPWRLLRTSSRLGELRAEQSAEGRCFEEEFAAKKADLARLITQHKALHAEMQSQRGSSKPHAID
jgi:hypothetical protein